MKSEGPRLLVISENFHPHWRVLVDGQNVEMYRANYVWRAACLPPGDHMVESIYESPTVRIARWIMLLTFIGTLGVVAWEFKSRRPAVETR